MENVVVMPNLHGRINAENFSGLDTKLVTFFLAMDAGRTLGRFDMNEILTLFTILTFILFSYFLPIPAVKDGISTWIFIRVIVVSVGLIAGIGVNVISELLLMQSFKFVPMIFLIFTGFLCAATQIRGIIRVRLAG